MYISCILCIKWYVLFKCGLLNSVCWEQCMLMKDSATSVSELENRRNNSKKIRKRMLKNTFLVQKTEVTANYMLFKGRHSEQQTGERKEGSLCVAMYSSVTIIFSTISRGLGVLHRSLCPWIGPNSSPLSPASCTMDPRRLIRGTHLVCAVSQCYIISMYMCFLCPNCMHATDCSCACCHASPLSEWLPLCFLTDQLSLPLCVCVCQFFTLQWGVICVPKVSLPQVQTLRPHFSVFSVFSSCFFRDLFFLTPCEYCKYYWQKAFNMYNASII